MDFFPENLKLADITPIFKSVDSMAKKNYRPLSISNSVSKLFETLTQKQTLLDEKFCEIYVVIEKENPLNMLF